MSTLETKNQQNLQYLQYQQNQPHKIYNLKLNQNIIKIFEKNFSKKISQSKNF